MGLTERTLKDGTTVFEVHARLGGKLRRHTLKAQTKTDAIARAAGVPDRLRTWGGAPLTQRGRDPGRPRAGVAHAPRGPNHPP